MSKFSTYISFGLVVSLLTNWGCGGSLQITINDKPISSAGDPPPFCTIPSNQPPKPFPLSGIDTLTTRHSVIQIKTGPIKGQHGDTSADRTIYSFFKKMYPKAKFERQEISDDRLDFTVSGVKKVVLKDVDYWEKLQFTIQLNNAQKNETKISITLSGSYAAGKNLPKGEKYKSMEDVPAFKIAMRDYLPNLGLELRDYLEGK